jgi:hypothetical protein
MHTLALVLKVPSPNSKDLIRSAALLWHCFQVHAPIQICISDQICNVASVVVPQGEGRTSGVEDADLVTYSQVMWSRPNLLFFGHEVWALLTSLYRFI